MGSWLTDESLINLVPRIICIIRTNESYAYRRTVPTAGEKCLLAPVGQYNSILLSILPPTMINGSTKDRDGSTKASSGSESSLRKFTLSCSRYRASKLKCDKNEPCVCGRLHCDIDVETHPRHVDGMPQA